MVAGTRPAAVGSVRQNIVATVDEAGRAQIEVDVVIQMPDRIPTTVSFALPLAARGGFRGRYVFTTSAVTVHNHNSGTTTVLPGTVLDDEPAPIRHVMLSLADPEDQVHLTLTYTVEHAARIEGDKAIFFYDLPDIATAVDADHATTVEIRMPGPVVAAGCDPSYSLDDAGANSCRTGDQGVIHGNTASYRGSIFLDHWFEVSTPATAMPGASPLHHNTLGHQALMVLLGMLGAGAVLGLGAGAWRLARTARNGRVDSTPPELPVLAGAALHPAASGASATMAALVRLELDNVIHLSIDPFMLSPNDGSADEPGLEGVVYGVALSYAGQSKHERRRAMATIKHAVETELEQEQLARKFVLPTRSGWAWARLAMVGLGVLAIGLVLGMLRATSPLPAFGLGATLLLVGLLFWSSYKKLRALRIASQARPLQRQIERFSDFLSADGLADLDQHLTEESYLKGLPWAVYVGKAPQWLMKCRAAAAVRGVESSNWPLVATTAEQWEAFDAFVRGQGDVTGSSTQPQAGRTSSAGSAGSTHDAGDRTRDVEASAGCSEDDITSSQTDTAREGKEKKPAEPAEGPKFEQLIWSQPPQN